MDWDWIVFDADETLFTFDAFGGLQRMFRTYDVTFTADEFADYQQVNKPLWVEYQNGLISAAQLQTQRFEHWATRLQVSPQELNTAFLRAMADICEPLPGARALLDALKGKVRLGIITNGFTALQKIRLTRTGFLDYFDLLVISEEIGVAKPDRRIFDYALEKMGNPPRERVMMVGDTPESDILGGMNAGLATCWLNRREHTLPEGISPCWQVTHLNELQALLTPP